MKYFVVLFILAFAACQSTSERSSDIVTVDRDGYTIEYPKDWTEHNNALFNTSLFLKPKMDSTSLFQSNFIILVQDLTGMDMDIEQYTALTLEQSPLMITNYKLISSEPYGDGHALVISGKQGQSDLKWHQFFWVANDKGYVLTYTALLNAVDPHIEEMREMVRSFKVK